MKKLSDIFENQEMIIKKQDSFLIKPEGNRLVTSLQKKRVNLIAAGDVGSTLLTGLHLLGGDHIESIGVYDLNSSAARRIEMEINQVGDSLNRREMPPVQLIDKEQLFSCDVLVFTATRGIPSLENKDTDVRMAQLEANQELISDVADTAAAAGFSGLLAVVSDPVDPLCKAAYLRGLARDQVQGYGLGVMNRRARYYAQRDDRFAGFAEEGRVFGPHGQDLVVADSIEHYNHQLSLELTKLTVEANKQVRELGFKPYIGPALSSGALAILDTLEGLWNYSSVYFGKNGRGAFLGARNRRTPYGIEVEDQPLPDQLFDRIKSAYENLRDLI